MLDIRKNQSIKTKKDVEGLLTMTDIKAISGLLQLDNRLFNELGFNEELMGIRLGTVGIAYELAGEGASSIGKEIISKMYEDYVEEEIDFYNTMFNDEGETTVSDGYIHAMINEAKLAEYIDYITGSLKEENFQQALYERISTLFEKAHLKSDMSEYASNWAYHRYMVATQNDVFDYNIFNSFVNYLGQNDYSFAAGNVNVDYRL